MKNRNIRYWITLFAIGAVLPTVQAVVPAPDGGYPGGNTAEGQNALSSLTTGNYNTAIGLYSLLSLDTGNFNTGVGAGTLLANTADENTATGAGALLSNSTGTGNTANGAFALFSNTTGVGETADGNRALFANTIGDFNTAIGSGALQLNTEGENNTAVGAATLIVNTTGSRNTATGVQALFLNTASDNTAYGYKALDSNTTGFFNTAVGDEALQTNTDGGGNTALGYFSLHNSTGTGNLAIGTGAGTNLTTGNNNIYIGNVGAPGGESNTTRIGLAKTTQRTFIDGIRGVTTGINDAVNVVIDSAGQLGTVSSSQRFKTDIKPMNDASGSILGPKPVTFRYKGQNDSKPQFGLIAEEVAQIDPNLVVRDEHGEIYTVRYDAVNAMLLNEFLKEHKTFVEEQGKVREQEATITTLKSKVD